MSMASDISTISSSLNAIKNAIIDKGVTPSGNITTYADAISQIPTASTGTNLSKGTYSFTADNGETFTIIIQCAAGYSENRVSYDSTTNTITITGGLSNEPT